MKELIAEVTKNDKFLRLKSKAEFYENPELIHRTASLLLFNDKQELMLRKIAQRGRGALDLYDFSVTGTVAGESYKSCLERAIREELGIELKITELFKFFYEDYLGRCFNTVFVVEQFCEPQNLIIKSDAIRWISLATLKKDLKQFEERFDPQFIQGVTKYLDANLN